MKIVTDKETKFMDPMTDEQVLEYSATVVSEMDESKVISAKGMEYLLREDNIPNEEDQEKVMSMIDKLYKEHKKEEKVAEAEQVDTPSDATVEKEDVAK